MALDPVILDDLDWKGMVESIRRRIPAASDGAWTLHSPTDPGITLLELFAWQLEQRLYRMDQVSESLNLALLAILGIRPRRTRCATTVMQLQSDQALPVPRGAQFTLNGSTPPTTYSTRSALMPLRLKAGAPNQGLRLWIGERERTTDFAAGRVLRLFPADGGPASARIELTLDAAPHPANAWLGLWFKLRTAASIPPQWSADAAAGVPQPAQLAWLYRSNDGSLQPFTVDDGTAGLRRSGVVRLSIPANWQAEPGGGLVYAIHLRTERASWAAPPRLVSLVPNAVVARHARATRLHGLTRPLREWLPLPGNVIRLDELPLDEPDKDIPVLESACVLCMKERDGSWHHWWPAMSLHAAGPASRRFIVDREHAQLRFGDGLNGRLPVLAEAGTDIFNIRLRYGVGGGEAGAVGPSPGPLADWSGPDSSSARNLTASLGGTDAEDIDEARRRCASSQREATRAVTRADFKNIALATPGIALKRAHAAIGRHPSHPCASVPGAVTVYIVPEVPREDLDPDLVEDAFVAAPLPDPGQLAAVQAELERARLIGTELFVTAPRYRAVLLSATLRGDVHDLAALQQGVFDRLQSFLDALVGGDDGTGWPFGEPVRASVMLREVQAVVGPQARVTQVAIGLDGNEPDESCRAVAIGPNDLVWLQGLSLQLERSAAPAGGLR